MDILLLQKVFLTMSKNFDDVMDLLKYKRPILLCKKCPHFEQKLVDNKYKYYTCKIGDRSIVYNAGPQSVKNTKWKYMCMPYECPKREILKKMKGLQ